MNQTPVRTPVWHRILSFCLVLVLLAALVPPSALKVSAVTTATTVYFENNWNWTDVRIHYWNSSSNNGWPGNSMTEHGKTTAGKTIYKFTIPAGTTGVIFNGIKDDGSGNRDQSPNIEGDAIKTNVCYYMNWNNGNQVLTYDYVVECSHSYNSGTVTTQPGCETTGVRTKTCTKCSATTTETIAATGHAYGTGTVTEEATCTTAGVKTYTCANDSSHTTTESIPATGHQFANGYNGTCTVCGVEYAGELSSWYIRGDVAGNWDPGVALYKTGNADVVTLTVQLSAGTYKFKMYGDTWYGNNGTINDTTTASNGWEMTTDSGDCTLVATGGTYTFNFTISTKKLVVLHEAAHEHSYTSEKVTTEPGCETPGEKVLSCECGHSKTVEIPATGHTIGANNKCTVCGQACSHSSHDTTGKCVGCGQMIDHNYTVDETVVPTCTEDGYTQYSCDCGSVYVGDFVYALGHDVGDGEVVAPTCTEEGYTKYTCAVCGFITYGDRKNPTGHSDPLEVIEDVASKCNVRGYTKYQCADCDYTTVEYKEMAEHNYVDDVCSVCGDKKGTTRRIYFDATLSKMAYSDAGDYGIPNKSNTIRFYATGSGMSDAEDTMTALNDPNWPDLYYVDLDSKYTKIAFSSFDMSSSTNYGGHGESTTLMTIPTNANTCFYADSSDKVIYDGGQRDGYWGEPFQIRSAEFMKGKDVVVVPEQKFTPAADTMYVGTTFYDYYTDYELNGYNRKDYTTWGGDSFASQRNWVPFRHFNQALSNYYDTNDVTVPIYTGHFQPHWGEDTSLAFRNISGNLKLYGFEDGQAYNSTSIDQKYFMSVNNSRLEVGSDSIDHKINSAAQGIVDNQLNNGALTTSGKAMPYFDENFINGTNSKHTKLGEVYENVQFPFTKVTDNGVQYWAFDSSQTTLQMTKDNSGKVGYYLNTASGDKYLNLNAGSEKQSSKGFFPFNNNSSAGNANTYNYGYGARIDVDFTLSDDGMVLDEDGNKKPMIFTFSGDDDVWVFIDGELVLDIGGAHGKVTGEINFAEGESTVSAVKSSGGTRSPSTTHSFTVDNSKTHHTLTMFYMERGMWESNMSIRFNFIPQNVIMPETTSITATKNWNLDTKTASAVNVQLQRRVGNGTWENVGAPVTMTPSGNTATHLFENVKQYADEAQTIAYTFRVVELDGNNNAMNDGDVYDDLVVAYGKMEGSVGIGYTQTISNNEVVVQKLVIDFGLPVEATIFVPMLADTIEAGTLCGIGDPTQLPIGKIRESTADPDLVTTIVPGKYGNFTISGNKVRYTPTKMTMDAPETVGYAIQYQQDGVTYYYYSTVTVIPAANIYYEDYFLKFENSGAATANSNSGKWSAATTDDNKIQDEDYPGIDRAFVDFDANNVYGFDSHYTGYELHSLGAARSVTVNQTTGAADVAPTATFTFTGTGFDVVGLTDNNSGAIWVLVTDKNGDTVKSYIVNNYYGYTYDDGEWVITPSTGNALYQVPVIKVENLTYGTYNVAIKAAYLTSMDMQEDGSYTVWLDAIRIYNPAKGDGTSEGAYAQDGESNPHYVNVKDLLLDPGEFTTGNEADGVVFVDGKSSGVTIDEYANQGPNNEAYLMNGHAIAFRLRFEGVNKPNLNLQIGAKLAKGTGVTLKCTGREDTTLATATNMFYKLGALNWEQQGEYWVSDPIVVSCSATDDSILSLTDLKITGADAAAIESMSSAAAEPALMLMSDEVVIKSARRFLMASAAPEIETFTINAAQVELGNALNLYFLFPADAYTDWTGCYAEVTKTYADGRDAVTVTVPAEKWEDVTNGSTALKRVGFHNISAKEMADTVTIRVFNADGQAISNDYSDTIVAYLDRMLDKNSNPEFLTLAVDMLNYGAAAQTQFNYNTDNLANAILTEEQKAYGTAENVACVNNQLNGNNVIGMAVELNNNIVVNVFFQNQTAEMKATVTTATGEILVEDLVSTETENGYCFVVDELTVADMRTMIIVTAYNADGSVYGTVTDSVESYVARTGVAKAINQAIMKFSDSAKAYLNND